MCLNGDVIRRETISAMPAGNAKFLMDSVFELAQRINRFRLSDAEIGLFCSVVIITAGTSIFFLFSWTKQTPAPVFLEIRSRNEESEPKIYWNQSRIKIFFISEEEPEFGSVSGFLDPRNRRSRNQKITGAGPEASKMDRLRNPAFVYIYIMGLRRAL